MHDVYSRNAVAVLKLVKWTDLLLQNFFSHIQEGVDGENNMEVAERHMPKTPK